MHAKNHDGSGIKFTMQNTCTACNGHGAISISKSQKNWLHQYPSCRGIGEACYGG